MSYDAKRAAFLALPEWKRRAIAAARSQNARQRQAAKPGNAGLYCTAAVAPLGR